MVRTGFTLVEMLVATMVFVIGFVAVYSLFLAGMNYRHESDRLTGTALAATSLISNWRLEMAEGWDLGSGDVAPGDLVGDGDPTNGAESGEELFPYPDDPNIWYRVDKATDLAGDDTNVDTAGIQIVLLLVEAAGTPGNLSLTDIRQRHFVDPLIHTDYLDSTFPIAHFPHPVDDATAKAAYMSLSSDDKSTYVLVWRKILSRHEAVLLRR